MENSLTTGSILSLFQTTKEQRQSFVANTINCINNGEISALNVHLQVRCMEDIIKSLKDNPEYKATLLSEVEKQGKKFNYQNAEFSVKEVGVKYDYSQCGDNSLLELYAKMDALVLEIKAKEKRLQSVNPKGEKIVTDEGEVVELFPPSKSSTTSVVVTLK